MNSEVDVRTQECKMIFLDEVGELEQVLDPFSCIRSLDGILGSCGDDGVRLWNLAASDHQQVVHVATAPAACLALAFVPDGGAVVVGLDDGSLRAFTPQSGNMLFR